MKDFMKNVSVDECLEMSQKFLNRADHVHRNGMYTYRKMFKQNISIDQLINLLGLSAVSGG
jgi:hypothetical protein